jgi:hypothetical protein
MKWQVKRWHPRYTYAHDLASLAHGHLQAEAAVDERDDLAQRIRFLEKQLIALRHEAGK